MDTSSITQHFNKFRDTLIKLDVDVGRNHVPIYAFNYNSTSNLGQTSSFPTTSSTTTTSSTAKTPSSTVTTYSKIHQFTRTSIIMII